MARNYHVWFLENNSQMYLDSGTRMVHDGKGHHLYRYENGKLLKLNGNETLEVRADGRIIEKTGNQVGFITDYQAFTDEIRQGNTRSGSQQKKSQKTHIWRYILVIIGVAFMLYQNQSSDRAGQNRAAGTSAAKAVTRTTTAPVNTPMKAPTAPPTAVPTAVPTSAARLERNWQAMMAFPDVSEISQYNRIAVKRSPYLAAWMKTGSKTFSGYTVDFRAEFQPNGTYCCLGNFDLDYSALKKTYKSYNTEYQGVGGYAGLQRLYNGELKSILSFWDIQCTDKSGKKKTIRAKLVYPSHTDNDSFSGEGTGAHCLVDYPWKPGKWYQMQLLCGKSDTTGNTTIEQWIQDLSTSMWTKLCVYDLGVPNVSFKGDVCVFLENFVPEYAGEIRTMECRNFAVYRNKWTSIKTGVVYSDNPSKYQGSYAYKADGDTLCMITTGVAGKAPAAKKLTFKLK